LYCIKVRANEVNPRAAVFFDEPGLLASGMEAIARSYCVAHIGPKCRAQSNAGKAPLAGAC